MKDYRLYCLDGAANISFAEEVAAESDQEAVAAARSLKPDALKWEVWLGSRLVASLTAEELANALDVQRA